MFNKIVLSVFLICLFVGCAASRIALDHTKLADKLQLKITFDESIDKESIKLINVKADDFIRDYNAEHHLFDVVLNNEARDNYLSVNIKEIEYVGVGNQLLSIIVSGLGAATLAYTIANPVTIEFPAYKLRYYFFFWWSPEYSLTAELFLSNDIDFNAHRPASVFENRPSPGLTFNNVTYPLIFSNNISNFHWFKSIEGQRNSLAVSFYHFMFDTMNDLETN